MTEWAFLDPPSTAVFTTRSIIHEGAWIALVTHDEDDGTWQFHDDTPGPARVEDGMVVGLDCMVARDPTLHHLADLPEGWQAWRDGPAEPWQRGRLTAP